MPIGDITCCSANSILPARASLGTVGCEAAGTMEPHPPGWSRAREPTWRLPALRWSGARRAWEGQHRCMADNRRAVRQAESAETLGPKGLGSGTGAQASPVAEGAPRRRGQTSPRWGQRRNVGNPSCSLRGKEAARQAERGAGQGGWSTRRPPCHEVERGCAVRHHAPRRQRADFPRVSRHANNGGIGTEGVAHVGGFVPLVLPSPEGHRLPSSLVQPACFSC